MRFSSQRGIEAAILLHNTSIISQAWLINNACLILLISKDAINLSSRHLVADRSQIVQGDSELQRSFPAQKLTGTANEA